MQELLRDLLAPLTTQLHAAAWSMPLGQGLHLLGISLLLGGAVLLYPRLIAGQLHEPAADLAARHLPWMWTGFGLVAATGFVLFAAEPARMLRSPVFLTKMLLLALVLVLTIALGRWARSRTTTDGSAHVRADIRILAATSLVLWPTIAASGRLIGYWRRLMSHFFG